jgi:hypothetical protein
MGVVRGRGPKAFKRVSRRADRPTKPARYHDTRFKGESGEAIARLEIQRRWGILPAPTKRDGVHGPDLLYFLDREDRPPELDPFCGAGPFSALMWEVKSGVGLMKLRNWTSLLAGRGAGRQMGPAWRADQIKKLRAPGGAVARDLRRAGDPVPGMVIFDATLGSECLALVRINHWATAEVGERLVIASARDTSGFDATVRGIWPHAHTVVVGNPPFLSAYPGQKRDVHGALPVPGETPGTLKGRPARLSPTSRHLQHLIQAALDLGDVARKETPSGRRVFRGSPGLTAGQRDVLVAVADRRMTFWRATQAVPSSPVP